MKIINNKTSKLYSQPAAYFVGYDCGMYAIEMTRTLVEALLAKENISLTTTTAVTNLTPSHIEEARTKWAEIIVKLAKETS